MNVRWLGYRHVVRSWWTIQLIHEHVKTEVIIAYMDEYIIRILLLNRAGIYSVADLISMCLT